MMMMTTILLLLMMPPLMILVMMVMKKMMMLAMLVVMVDVVMVGPVVMDMAGVGVVVMSRVGVVDGVGTRRQWAHRRAMGTLMLEMRFQHSNPPAQLGYILVSIFLGVP